MASATVELTPFAAWLQRQMERRKGMNMSSVATHIGARSGVVNAWFNRGTLPNPESCRKIARLFGVSPLYVMELAGHLDATDTSMAEEETAYHVREIDPRVITLARELDDRMLNLWVEMGELMARAPQDES